MVDSDSATTHVVKPLTSETFPAWLALAQKHNGVWGGCWCSYFHGDTENTVKDEYDRPTFKQRLEAEGVAHAALVFDSDNAIAWCEFGSPAELPNIYHRKQHDAGETNPAPWRITCFFVDRDHRRSGVAREALDGALDLIAQAGGGEVVSFPNELPPGKTHLILLPSQRHESHVRESRFHLRASHRQKQDRHAQDHPTGSRGSWHLNFRDDTSPTRQQRRRRAIRAVIYPVTMRLSSARRSRLKTALGTPGIPWTCRPIEPPQGSSCSGCPSISQQQTRGSANTHAAGLA